MTIDKKINEDDLIKAKIKYMALASGGPNKPNGETTISLDDYLQILDPGGWATEDDKPKKVAYKYGANSKEEEDLIGRHVDDWTNAINKGDLDPSVDFMKYIDMILGRDSLRRGGIISAI
tara:strand:+ start:1615 stop:1974 length:360 start_codon:yes stop_codon:yes gene_type:complete